MSISLVEINSALNQKWLSYTHFQRRRRRPNERVTVMMERGKSNISIPFLTTIYDRRQSASLYSIFFLHSLVFMTFDSKNYWLHDKLSAFIVIYYVPKIAWDGGSWHSCCHVRNRSTQTHSTILSSDKDVKAEIVSLLAP